MKNVNKKIGIDISADETVKLLNKMSLDAKKVDNESVEVIFVLHVL